MPREALDWNELAGPNRVWLADNSSDSKARLEFLAQQGLRLMLVALDGQGGGCFHFSNPFDRETLHIGTTRGPELLLTASQCFPEARRWMETLGIREPAALRCKPGATFLEEGGSLLEARAGRLRGIREVASEWPGSVLGRKPAQAVAQIEQEHSRDGATARTVAFLQAVEEARGIKAPVAAMILRAVLIEMERTASHLSWMGRTCSGLGRDGLAMECLALRKELEEAQESWLGEAKGTGWCVAGGMQEEFPLDGIEAATETIAHILNGWKRMEKKLLALALPSWLSGRISSISWNARAEAWAGPLARAAGLEIDARAEESGPYQVLDWNPAGAQRGDAIPAALFEIKALEISASLEIVLLFLAELPGGPLVRKRGGRGKGQGFGRVEGPAGEVCCQVKLEKGLIKAGYFSSPGRFNRSILRAFKGAWLDEVEVASFLWG